METMIKNDKWQLNCAPDKNPKVITLNTSKKVVDRQIEVNYNIPTYGGNYSILKKGTPTVSISRESSYAISHCLGAYTWTSNSSSPDFNATTLPLNQWYQNNYIVNFYFSYYSKTLSANWDLNNRTQSYNDTETPASQSISLYNGRSVDNDNIGWIIYANGSATSNTILNAGIVSLSSSTVEESLPNNMYRKTTTTILKIDNITQISSSRVATGSGPNIHPADPPASTFSATKPSVSYYVIDSTKFNSLNNEACFVMGYLSGEYSGLVKFESSAYSESYFYTGHQLVIYSDGGGNWHIRDFSENRDYTCSWWKLKWAMSLPSTCPFIEKVSISATFS